MNTRFVLTYINIDGTRQLLGPNQGRLHSLTRQHAERGLQCMGNMDNSTIVRIWGPLAPNSFEVREAECYEHGDLKSIYFN